MVHSRLHTHKELYFECVFGAGSRCVSVIVSADHSMAPVGLIPSLLFSLLLLNDHLGSGGNIPHVLLCVPLTRGSGLLETEHVKCCNWSKIIIRPIYRPSYKPSIMLLA